MTPENTMMIMDLFIVIMNGFAIFLTAQLLVKRQPFPLIFMSCLSWFIFCFLFLASSKIDRIISKETAFYAVYQITLFASSYMILRGGKSKDSFSFEDEPDAHGRRHRYVDFDVSELADVKKTWNPKFNQEGGIAEETMKKKEKPKNKKGAAARRGRPRQ